MTYSPRQYHWTPITAKFLAGTDTSSVVDCCFELDKAEYCTIHVPDIRGELYIQGRLDTGSPWLVAFRELTETPIVLTPNSVRLVRVPYSCQYRFVSTKLQEIDIEIGVVGVYQVVVTALPNL